MQLLFLDTFLQLTLPKHKQIEMYYLAVATIWFTMCLYSIVRIFSYP